jgi:hypothetical protein
VVKALRTQSKGEFNRYRPSNGLSTMSENLYAHSCPLMLLRACLDSSLAQFHPLAQRVSWRSKWEQIGDSCEPRYIEILWGILRHRHNPVKLAISPTPADSWHKRSRSILLDVQQAMESMLASSQSLQHFGLVLPGEFHGRRQWRKMASYLRKKEMISCLRRNLTVIECDNVTMLHSWGNEQSRHSLC